MSESSGAPKPPPGWYPSPDVEGSQQYWNGEHWTDRLAPEGVRITEPTPGGITTMSVTIGILIAAVVIWLVYSVITADDERDCLFDNLDRAMDGLSQREC